MLGKSGFKKIFDSGIWQKKDNFFSEEERVIISNFLNKIINELELKINK